MVDPQIQEPIPRPAAKTQKTQDQYIEEGGYYYTNFRQYMPSYAAKQPDLRIGSGAETQEGIEAQDIKARINLKNLPLERRDDLELQSEADVVEEASRKMVGINDIERKYSVKYMIIT